MISVRHINVLYGSCTKQWRLWTVRKIGENGELE